MKQEYQPLHQKYRPTRFDDLIGQEVITATLKQALISNKIAPAYLFSGPRGTGKTSSARILARSLNCLNNQSPTIKPCGSCNLCQTITSGTALDVIEIDAASNTGVENIRELIEKAQFAPVQARWKVYVIDECHMLSTAAFNALLKTLEEPPSQVVFILATTDPQRVLPTILSRCMRFDFRRIPTKNLINHLEMIANQESISIEIDALELIAKRAQGGLRDAESMLDQLSLMPSPIKISSVWNLLGAIPEQELLSLASSITKRDTLSILSSSRKLIDNGKEPISILQGVAGILRDLVIHKVAPNKPELCNISKDGIKELGIIGHKIDLDTLLNFQAKLKGSEIELRQSHQPRLWLEIILLGIIGSPNKNNKDEEIPQKIIENKNIKVQIHNSLENKKYNSATTEIKKEPQTKETKGAEKIKALWDQIIATLELPSTKMLLSQQAKLIAINDKRAEIGVSSKWKNMLESRKKIIEEAVKKATGSQREVILISQDDQIERVRTGEKTNHQTIESKQITKTNKISKEVMQVNDYKNSNLNKEKLIPENKEEKNNLINQRDRSIQNNGSIDTKAQKFAEFFNGQIVDIDSQDNDN